MKTVVRAPAGAVPSWGIGAVVVAIVTASHKGLIFAVSDLIQQGKKEKMWRRGNRRSWLGLMQEMAADPYKAD